MRIFRCDQCGHLVFFENVACTHCGATLAFLPDAMRIAAVVNDGPHWRVASRKRKGRRRYRLCRNYSAENICNWAIPASDPNPLCRSCRLTQVLPDLSVPGNKQAWYKLEAAKRRMLYSLLDLGLAVNGRDVDPKGGLSYQFLADTPAADGPVLTGHDSGLITINIAEADDVEREKRRTELHEPYRTLLGHFRHEIGHFYWDQLIAGSPRLDAFREMFGDERADYGEALRVHYEKGPPPDWQNHYVSAYAASHPWEDWAESWAHYLHMTDTLETAAACGLSLRDTPSAPSARVPGEQPAGSFERMMARWLPLTFALNNLNRGLGLPDAYPFVLSPPAVEKLRFLHDTIGAYRKEAA